MGKKYVRYADLAESGILTSRMQLKRLIKDAGFPKGIKISDNTRIWDEAEVDSWLDSRRACA